ncbi:methyltransferase [Dorea formicigenerans]|uniref:Methyltransferase n=1 Tax=Dorea formicigenerans TaxID=39486 RepID=A0A3E5EQG5_9FIRM|nr:methyltransferase [Dorea formicigenerans]RHC51245.1 methyltransferase [Dorea formicigenerans]
MTHPRTTQHSQAQHRTTQHSQAQHRTTQLPSRQ